MKNITLSYREVIPDLSKQDDWIEIEVNTGGAQSTLQDLKVSDKSGGYCYQNVQLNHKRNRFIYWRTYQDFLELSEICLDFNLYQNNVRYKFTDSPVVGVSITEHERNVVVLITTVGSLHRIDFPHPDILADGGSSVATSSLLSSSNSSGGSSGGISIENTDSQSFSIFREANSISLLDSNNCFGFETSHVAINNQVMHTSTNYLSPDGERAYFAVSSPSQLTLFIMKHSNGHTTVQNLKEHHIMPRLFSNLKEAFIGKTDPDTNFATSLTFVNINENVYLMALYRNDFLRLWSTTTFQIVASINCVRDTTEPRLQGPQNNSLRKINNQRVCVFLSHSTGAEFVFIDINTDVGTNNINLTRRRVISTPQLDLVDFEVSELRIWALWSNAEGEFSVSSFTFQHGRSINWISAAMEAPPDRYCIGIEQGMDPREAYCSYIFHPGKFDRNVISKALFMFRRSSIRFETKHCNDALLKEHVCKAIEEDLQNEIKDFEVTDEEYLEIETRLWERFYSCCEQYHLKSSQPTGLLILEPIDAVCIIKKSTFSLLRPCEILEHLMLTAGDNITMTNIAPLHLCDEQLGVDFVNLVAIIAQIEKWLPEDVKLELDKKLYQLEMPNVLISKLTSEILDGDPDKEILPRNFLVSIRQKLQAIKDLNTPISLLLDSLRMDNGSPESMQTHLSTGQSSRFLLSIGALFGSNVGLSVLSETVKQTALIRFAICRNFLLLQQILIDTYTLSVEIVETLRSQFMPDTVLFLQSYYCMIWISEMPVNINTAVALETSIQRLNMLQLINGSGRIYSNGGKCCSAPLLRVFLNAKGLYTALSLYAENFRNLENPTWQNTLIPLTTIICQLIWPVSFNFVFGEWLFGTCQHIIIEDYVRLLNNWCEWNICSRQFMLAVSLLDCGESQKAYDLFLQSSKGVLKEYFLVEKILKNTPLSEKFDCMTIDAADNEDEAITLSNQAIAQYYLKVIQLFEQHNALNHIISMAQVAIGLLNKEDPQLPMFQSIVFNNHLQLEHYEEAYHSLIYNADPSRRKDCLRQLVITLFDRKRLDLLMHFPYVGLHEEFENIVESRARSLIIEQNEIYDFLYAFHVNSGNMRKASATMYEQAMRFQLESESVESMQKRCSSLLVCINALHLIDTRYRWIAKPVTGEDYHLKSFNEKNTKNTWKMESDLIANRKQDVIVLEIKDIRRELLQTEALVLLAQHRKDIQSFFNAGPQELSMVMASCGLFTAALKLTKGFQLSVLPIFDCLTAACVRTADEGANEAWSWLQENDLADLPHRNKAADMAWCLLQKLVQDNELDGSTEIRKSVVNKLLSLNAFIPQWLYNDYKLTNCCELLRLFVKHNRLLEANELAQEMINAMLGAGSEYFSFKHPITVTNPAMCLPVNTLDLLLHGLKLNATEDIEYQQAAVELQELLHKYIETAQRTANDKIEIAFQMQNENRQQRQFRVQ